MTAPKWPDLVASTYGRRPRVNPLLMFGSSTMKCDTHHVEIGRYGPCSLCIFEAEGGTSALARQFMGIPEPRPYRVAVLCSCSADLRPDPRCPLCGGFGEIDVTELVPRGDAA